MFFFSPNLQSKNLLKNAAFYILKIQKVFPQNKSGTSIVKGNVSMIVLVDDLMLIIYSVYSSATPLMLRDILNCKSII